MIGIEVEVRFSVNTGRVLALFQNKKTGFIILSGNPIVQIGIHKNNLKTNNKLKEKKPKEKKINDKKPKETKEKKVMKVESNG